MEKLDEPIQDILLSPLRKKRKYILYVFYARITVLGAEIVVFLFRRR